MEPIAGLFAGHALIVAGAGIGPMLQVHAPPSVDTALLAARMRFPETGSD